VRAGSALGLAVVCSIASLAGFGIGVRSSTAADAQPLVVSPLVVSPGLVTGSMHRGEFLLGDLGCLHCHETDEATERRLFHKKAPYLGEVGSRVTPQYLRAFLMNPHGEKPGTPMPDLLHGLDINTRARAVEALVHFLASQTHDQKMSGVEADAYHLDLGKKLYHTVGCVACHEAQDDPPPAPGKHDATADAVRRIRLEQAGRQDATSVPLPKLAYKTTAEELARFLLDPRAARPSGRMPSLNLNPTEAKAIAMYLLRDQVKGEDAPEPKLIEGVKYTYHEAGFGKIEDLLKNPPKSRGSAPTISAKPRKRDNNFGLIFQGVLRVENAGKYKFHTRSDDGSMLWIGDKKVVDNDGQHGAQDRSGEVDLTKGTHPIRVAYFNAGGPGAFKVHWEGPGVRRGEIPSSALAHFGQAMKPLGSEDFEVDPELAERGRSLFGTLGCASCHEMGPGKTQIASQTVAKNLEVLGSKGGCLDDAPSALVPRYAFSKEMLANLRKSLVDRKKSIVANSTPKLEQGVAHAMGAYNCYACHERDKVGGPGPKRADYFLPSMEADLGDEARLPPSLTGVGRKLKEPWLEAVLVSAGTTRPYIATRMPQFGESHVGWLAKAFGSVDLQGEPATEKSADPKLAKDGRKLVGNKGLSCVSCHRYGKYDSLGIPAADLTQMTKRVRKEWFRSFLLDPESEKPGTRMPQFWPGGKAVRDDILEGSTDRQIEAIWSYLSKGKVAKVPPGIRKVGMELIPEDEPLIYRHFITGSGNRAIGVGYPEEVHLSWEANRQSLALAWKGSFIDASKHRSGRGAGSQGPLGTSVIKLVEGAPIAFLASETAEWPKESGKAGGFRTGGYRLDKARRPTFFYTLGDIRVEDFPRPVEDALDGYLERTLTFRSQKSLDGLWFRAAKGGSIVESASGTFQVDNAYKLTFQLPEGAKALVRDSGGSKELLVPVIAKDGVAKIVEVIRW